MALTISQGLAVSYAAVLNAKRKPANQWAESAFLRELERQGAIKHESLGPTIEATLDYQRNQGGAILSTDMQTTSLAVTEVLTAASYTPAQVSVPIVWSKMQEAQNPSENQKVALVTSLISNAIDTHDDLVEQCMFTTSTNGLLGLLTHMPTSGQGSDGGIDAATNTFWRNPTNTYVDDTDIESAFTITWNQAAKGSGSTTVPTGMVSDATTQALFEGTQQAQQRYVDTEDMKAGFKTLAFKTARYCFSQYGTTSVFFWNPKNLQLVVSKEYFRDRGDTMEIPNANGFGCKVYSALQFITNNKSRLGVVHV